MDISPKAKVTGLRTNLQIEIKELAREMIAQARPCRRLFELWFGHPELFLLSRDQYTNALSTKLHAQADVARRLNFQTDLIWT
jgi:hypothetical protein